MITPKSNKPSKPEKMNKNTQNDFSLGLSRDEILPADIIKARRIVKTQNVHHSGGIPTEDEKRFLRERVIDLMKDYAQAKAAGKCKGQKKHHNLGTPLDFDNLEVEMTKVLGEVETTTRNNLWDYRTRITIYENEIARQMGWRLMSDMIEE